MLSTNSLPSPCAPEVAESLGLAGLTVFPIPKTNIAPTVQKYAQERRRQLDEGTSVEETLIFTGATTAHVNAIRPADRDGIYPGRITFFGNDSGLLFIRIPTPIHEVAHRRLTLRIWQWVTKMGLDEYCEPVGASTYEAARNCRKEGDSGIRPNPPRKFGDSFPTLAIEAGNSQSYPRLLKDKDWWFDNTPPGMPQGDVKVVIIIKVFSQSKRVLLELWHRGLQSASQSVTIKPNPQVAFSIEREDWQTHWIVEGGPFKVNFEDVFLRPKEGDECDLILHEQDLTQLGISCWWAGKRCE